MTSHYDHYDGPERRTGNCEAHQQNTTAINTVVSDVASIKSSMFTARWIIGLLIAVGALIIAGTLNDIKASITELRQDVKLVLPSSVRIERLEAVADRHEVRIGELEKSTRDHHTHDPRGTR